MSLIDRYLHAVGEHIPASKRDDIVAELSDDLHAQAEERRAALGRPLTEDEQAALLKPYGHPMLLAARFRPLQHLVGPRVFPFYWATLKVALLVALAVQGALLIAFTAAGKPLGPAFGALARFPLDAGMTVFAWITLVFAVADILVARGKVPGRWDPRTLPAVSAKAATSGEPHQWQAVLEIAVSTLLLAWWTVLPQRPFLAFGPAASHLAWTPAIEVFYWPVLGLILASMLTQVARLVRPSWRRTLAGVRVVTTILGVLLLIMALRAGEFVAAAQPEAAVLARTVNLALRMACVGMLLAAVIAASIEVVRRVAARADLA